MVNVKYWEKYSLDRGKEIWERVGVRVWREPRSGRREVVHGEVWAKDVWRKLTREQALSLNKSLS